jgi:hypothetical protein
MSALEIIEQFKALPPQEKAVVLDFIRKMGTPPSPEVPVRYAEPTSVAETAEKIFDRYDDLFRKLAQ